MIDITITPPAPIVLELPESPIAVEDIPDLDASIITSGTIADERLPAGLLRDSEAELYYQPKIKASNAAATRALLEIDSYPALVGTAKPATRRDGSPLQVNDRWLDTSENTFWFWNGTYWLSERILSSNVSSFVSATTTAGCITADNHNLFLLRLEIGVIFSVGNHDVANNWSVRLRRLAANSTGFSIDATVSTGAAVTAATRVVYRTIINLHRDIAALSTAAFDFEFQKNGAAPNSTIGATLYYRLAKL